MGSWPPARKRDSFQPVSMSTRSRAEQTGLRSWARGQSLGLAIGLGCGVLVGALSFGAGRSFERSGVTDQRALPAAVGAWADPGASEEAGTALRTAAAEPDAAEQSTDPATDLLADIEQQDDVSPFAPPPTRAVQLAAVSGERGDGEELAGATIELLVQGKYDAALVWGRVLVATAPDDAFGYLCIGSALIDLGRRQEAHQTFRACVRRATRGDVSECLTFAGRS
jgi:hypothetical protein